MKRIPFMEGWTCRINGGPIKEVFLPHDGMQELGRDKGALSGKNGAYYKSGHYVYEKRFVADASWENQEVYLEFEGVYPSASIFLNEKKIGSCSYGYSTFLVPCQGILFNQENVLRVVVDDTNHPNSRWYAGAGIYRPVWLLLGEKKHIAANGIKITTLSFDPAVISFDVKVTGEKSVEEILVDIYDGDNLVASAKGAHGQITIPDAKLWNDKNPNLYRINVRLMENGILLDEVVENFGIRKLEWSAQKGFLVNGQVTLLKGGCIHHDNGILGARSYAQAEWRKIKRLKDFGYNAIRSAHNPISRAMLEACDALGMYVMDEAWDTWYQAKNPYDCSNGFLERYEMDLQQMVDKDYNHPSVVMYSVGNEVTEPIEEKGVEMANTLVKAVKKLDATRPVTAGINITLLVLAAMPSNPIADFAAGGEDDKEEKKDQAPLPMSSEQYNAMTQRAGGGMGRLSVGDAAEKVSQGVLDALDIAGYNYGTTRYEMEGDAHPNRVVVGSETYCQDIGRIWPLVEKYPYLIGDFMWTAWDYLGEVGIGGYSYEPEDFVFDKPYPWKLSDAGAIDILGNDTAEAGLAKVVFTGQMQPYIGVTPANHGGRELARAVWRGTNARPHWSYQGCNGALVTVEIYSAASEVELFVNEKSLGRKKLEDYQTSYEVAYENGKIRAVAYDTSGNAVGESALVSATGKTRLAITQEKDILPVKKDLPSVKKDSALVSCEEERLVYLDLALVGENGEIECNDDQLLEVSVEGGRLLAFGSANPKTEDEYLTGRYHTYFGRAQAIIGLPKEKNKARFCVYGERIEPVTMDISL